MDELIERMAEVANDMDEAGLTEQASRVDGLIRELTSQIGGASPIGDAPPDDLEEQEQGMDQEIDELGRDVGEESRVRLQQKRQQLDALKKRREQQKQMPVAPQGAGLPTA